MQCDYYDAGACRSCSLMGTPYQRQLVDKQRHVEDVLRSTTAGVHWLAPIRSRERAFRNKAKLVVGGRAGAPTLGILDADGHGVDLRECGLYETGLAATFDALHGFVADLGIAPYDVPRRSGELKYVVLTHSPDGEQLVRFVVRSRQGLALVRAGLPRLQAGLSTARVVTVNLHPEHKAVLEGEEEVVLTDERDLAMRVGAVTLRLGPRAFFQTNTAVARALYAQVSEWADAVAPRTVWDLYCGVGGFALHLAREGRRVVGVETAADAVAAASASARGAPGDVVFHVGDATADIPPGPSPDLVVVNPPRRGIGPDLARWLEAGPAGHVVYSTCNVDTLARDLAAMPSLRPVAARVADMFPQTRHVETVLLLERR